jgi:hypothetical protein
MKKKLLFTLLIFVLLFYNLFSLYSKPLHEPLIKGGYKSCTVYTYNYLKGVINKKSRQKINYYKYDKNGKKVEYISYNPKGLIGLKHYISYDIMGNDIDNEKLHSDSTFYSHFAYKYDDKGNKVEEISYDSSGLMIWKSTLNYNENGNIIEYKVRQKDNFVYYHQKFIYEKNNEIKEEVYYSDNLVVDKKFYIIKDDRTKIEQIKNNKDHSITNIRTVNYDNMGNIIEDTRYSPAGSVYWKIKSKDEISKNQYNKNGNIIECIEYDKSNKPIKKTEYVYSK